MDDKNHACTVDPWTTWIWSTYNLYADYEFTYIQIFKKHMYYSMPYFMTGWIWGCGTSDTAGQLQIYTQIFNCAGVGVPIPQVVQRSTVVWVPK